MNENNFLLFYDIYIDHQDLKLLQFVQYSFLL